MAVAESTTSTRIPFECNMLTDSKLTSHTRAVLLISFGLFKSVNVALVSLTLGVR